MANRRPSGGLSSASLNVVQPEMLLYSLLGVEDLRAEETLDVSNCSVVVGPPDVVW